MSCEMFRDTLAEYFIAAGKIRSTALLKKLTTLRKVSDWIVQSLAAWYKYAVEINVLLIDADKLESTKKIKLFRSWHYFRISS